MRAADYVRWRVPGGLSMKDGRMRPVMSCADAMRRLWEYLDRTLPEAEAHDVHRHLAECARCRPHAAFERRLLDEIAAVRPEPEQLAALRDRMPVTLSLTCRRVDWNDA